MKDTINNITGSMPVRLTYWRLDRIASFAARRGCSRAEGTIQLLAPVLAAISIADEAANERLIS
jgi:mRNA-degrading endonuclease toxin of MazEF toxin-antitoxin module